MKFQCVIWARLSRMPSFYSSTLGTLMPSLSCLSNAFYFYLVWSKLYLYLVGNVLRKPVSHWNFDPVVPPFLDHSCFISCLSFLNTLIRILFVLVIRVFPPVSFVKLASIPCINHLCWVRWGPARDKTLGRMVEFHITLLDSFLHAQMYSLFPGIM